MTRGGKRAAGALTALAFWAFTTAALADTVLLTDGTRYDNVKTFAKGNDLYVIFENGTITTAPNNRVKSVTLVRVQWARESRIDKDQLNRLVNKKVQQEIERREKIEANKRALRRKARAEKERRLANARRAEKAARVWRSALLPGWGEYYRGDRARGALYFGTWAFFANYYRQSRLLHARAQRAYGDYLLPATLALQGRNGMALNVIYFNERRDELLLREAQTNRAFYALSLVWIWNVLDVLLFDANPETAGSNEGADAALTRTNRPNANGAPRLLFSAGPGNRYYFGLEVSF